MDGQPVRILAVETSCDDTGVAVLEDFRVLSNVTASQEIHARYGGVVPELAGRAHLVHLVPTWDAALAEAGISADDVDAVACTRGPGLQGSLAVGFAFAKSWAWARALPFIPVHHLHAHLYAHFLEPGPVPGFPFLCLLVSGGHTQLVRVDGPGQLHRVAGGQISRVARRQRDRLSASPRHAHRSPHGHSSHAGFGRHTVAPRSMNA